GIPGSPTDHHTAPYAMTEEFTAVYRMHSLLPDEFSFRSHRDGSEIAKHDFAAVTRGGGRVLYNKGPYEDVLHLPAHRPARPVGPAQLPPGVAQAAQEG